MRRRTGHFPLLFVILLAAFVLTALLLFLNGQDRALRADYLASLLNLFLIELLRHTEPPARAEKKRASTRYQENQIMNEALQIISVRCRERLSLG